MQKKGWIALDIDGTITLEKYSVPQPVIDYLRGLHQEGWKIVLATGRAFIYAFAALKKFDFPFVLLPQNGSVGLEMPEKKLLFKRYLSPDLVQVVEEAFEGFEGDYIIYSGYDNNDLCYWRPKRLSSEDREYIEHLQKQEREPWEAVEKFPLHKEIPIIKCFGTPHRMKILEKKLLEKNCFEVTHIRDVFHDIYTLLLVTAKGVSKGSGLMEVLKEKGREGLVIAAGDDDNDISLLQVADIKIAMAHAPNKIQEIADFIAPPTKDLGIIHALQMSIKNGRR